MADLEAWMRVGYPIETVLGDTERVLDAWQSGGVKGILIGPLRFDTGLPDAPSITDLRGAHLCPPSDPRRVAAFEPNPTIYRRYGVVAPSPSGHDMTARWAALGRFLDAVKRKNIAVWIIEPDDGMVAPDPSPNGDALPSDLRHRLLFEETWQRAFIARVEDTLGQVPQADGIILTGPEWGYLPGTTGPEDFLGPLPATAAPLATALGFDLDRLIAAQTRLVTRLRKLTREASRLGAGGGAFATTTMLGNDPGIVSWLTFRARALSKFLLAVHDVTERLGKSRGKEVKFGLNPMMPSLAPLAGYDFPGLATVCDMVVPRFGIHHRGTDGLYGLLSKWVGAMNEWSSSLWEAESFEAVGALTGLHLPSSDPAAPAGQRMLSLRDFERGYPEAFWREVMVPEARRAIAQADGYPWRVLPSVGTGRRPQGGDPVGVADFRRLLDAIKEGGVRQVVYHNYSHLTPGEWSMLSEISGTAWRPGSGTQSGYEPPDL